jgi:hypothetical protein
VNIINSQDLPRDGTVHCFARDCGREFVWLRSSSALFDSGNRQQDVVDLLYYLDSQACYVELAQDVLVNLEWKWKVQLWLLCPGASVCSPRNDIDLEQLAHMQLWPSYSHAAHPTITHYHALIYSTPPT